MDINQQAFPYLELSQFPYLRHYHTHKPFELLLAAKHSSEDDYEGVEKVLEDFRANHQRYQNDFLYIVINSQGSDAKSQPNRPGNEELRKFKSELCRHLTIHDPTLRIVAVHQNSKGKQKQKALGPWMNLGHFFNSDHYQPKQIADFCGKSWPSTRKRFQTTNARMVMFLVREDGSNRQYRPSPTVQEDPVPGWVYLLQNPAWPDWVKIGKTNDLSRRLKEFNTGAPCLPFYYTISTFFPNPNSKASDDMFAEALEVEQTIHSILRQDQTIHPVGSSSEWYRMSVEEATQRIQEILATNHFETITH